MTKIENISFKKRETQDWKSMLNLVYPVGSIYMSYRNESPISLFGGNWVEISDCFLYCGKDNWDYAPDNRPNNWDNNPNVATDNGHTGGNNRSTLPRHNHDVTVTQSTHTLTHESHTHAPNSLTGQNPEACSYIRSNSPHLKNIEIEQKQNARYRVEVIDRYPRVKGTQDIIPDQDGYIWYESNAVKYTTIPSHSFTTNVSVSIEEKGVDALYSNMPFYCKVHCWRRIG